MNDTHIKLLNSAEKKLKIDGTVALQCEKLDEEYTGLFPLMIPLKQMEISIPNFA